jgi:hypothetical protein
MGRVTLCLLCELGMKIQVPWHKPHDFLRDSFSLTESVMALDVSPTNPFHPLWLLHTRVTHVAKTHK